MPGIAVCTCPVPLPFKIPKRVVEPVPPFATATVPVTLSAVPPMESEEAVPVRPVPAPVKEEAVMVEVAVKVEARTSPPGKTAEPATERVRQGVEVPMPTEPVKDGEAEKTAKPEPVSSVSAAARLAEVSEMAYPEKVVGLVPLVSLPWASKVTER